MLPTWLIYTVAYILVAVFFWLPGRLYRTISPKEALKLYIGAGIIFLATTFNILYTAMMGWNRYPESTLELVLDCITGLIHVVGIIYYYYTWHQILEKRKKATKVIIIDKN